MTQRLVARSQCILKATTISIKSLPFQFGKWVFNEVKLQYFQSNTSALKSILSFGVTNRFNKSLRIIPIHATIIG